MKILLRYVIKSNIKILTIILSVATILYILTDLFERLDRFIENNVPIITILLYFVEKTPLAISQILPFTFLLATIIQLCLMAKNKELIALQSGGISYSVLTNTILICGVFWGTTQFIFAEYLGVIGKKESTRIWTEDIRKTGTSGTTIKNIWFIDTDWVVSLNTLYPDNTGTEFTAYRIDQEGLNITTIVWASSFSVQNNQWTLYDATESNPKLYTKEFYPELHFPLTQSLDSLRIINIKTAPEELPIWELSETIKELESSGSNVEKLITLWHGKIAYAASLLVMAVLSMAIISWKTQFSIAIPAALIYTIIYFSLYIVGTSLAKKGTLHPFIGAWLANIVIFSIASWKIFFKSFITNLWVKQKKYRLKYKPSTP